MQCPKSSVHSLGIEIDHSKSLRWIRKELHVTGRHRMISNQPDIHPQNGPRWLVCSILKEACTATVVFSWRQVSSLGAKTLQQFVRLPHTPFTDPQYEGVGFETALEMACGRSSKEIDAFCTTWLWKGRSNPARSIAILQPCCYGLASCAPTNQSHDYLPIVMPHYRRVTLRMVLMTSRQVEMETFAEVIFPKMI